MQNEPQEDLWQCCLCMAMVPFAMPCVIAKHVYDKVWLFFNKKSLEEKLCRLQKILAIPEVTRSKDALLTWKKGGTVFVLLDRAYDTDMSKHIEKHWPYMSFVFIQANIHSINIDNVAKTSYAREPYKVAVHNMTGSMAYNVKLGGCYVRLGKIYKGPISDVFRCSYVSGVGAPQLHRGNNVIGFRSEKLS